MEIDVQENDVSISLKVYGDIEMIRIKAFKEKLSEIGEKADKDVEIDLSEVDYIDSSGIGILITLLRRQRNKGKKLIITKASPKVLEVFKLSSLLKIFKL